MDTDVKVPTDAAARKAIPLITGCFDYFPDALLAIAELSRIGNDQHNPGKPLHWDRSKSGDEADAMGRHMVDRGKIDTDGTRHSTKMAWRALALLQKEIEASRSPQNVAISQLPRAPYPRWWGAVRRAYPSVRLARADEVNLPDYNPTTGRDMEGDVWVMVNIGSSRHAVCIGPDVTDGDALRAAQEWFR